jgi:hypothetical protein
MHPTDPPPVPQPTPQARRAAVRAYAAWLMQAADELLADLAHLAAVADPARHDDVAADALLAELWSSPNVCNAARVAHPSLAAVYSTDSAAAPPHDGAGYSIGIPIRPGLPALANGPLTNVEPARAYFPKCPARGGRTGYFAFWHAHQSHQGEAVDEFPQGPHR